MRLAMSIAASLLLAMALPGSRAAGAPASGFKVIVNASNAEAVLSIQQLSQLFLKRDTRWGTGARVVPVDLPVNSPVRQEFSRAIHGRSAAAVDSFWSKQIFSGAALPPVTLPSEAAVIAYVRENPGAIGYVSATADLGVGVKAVDIAAR